MLHDGRNGTILVAERHAGSLASGITVLVLGRVRVRVRDVYVCMSIALYMLFNVYMLCSLTPSCLFTHLDVHTPQLPTTRTRLTVISSRRLQSGRSRPLTGPCAASCKIQDRRPRTWGWGFGLNCCGGRRAEGARAKGEGGEGRGARGRRAKGEGARAKGAKAWAKGEGGVGVALVSSRSESAVALRVRPEGRSQEVRVTVIYKLFEPNLRDRPARPARPGSPTSLSRTTTARVRRSLLTACVAPGNITAYVGSKNTKTSAASQRAARARPHRLHGVHVCRAATFAKAARKAHFAAGWPLRPHCW